MLGVTFHRPRRCLNSSCIMSRPCEALGSLLDLLKSTEIEHSSEKTTARQTYYDVVKGIVECFVYLHHGQIENPLIHRDLKPANVLIAGKDESDWSAKVADFGESTRFNQQAADDRVKEGGEEALTMVS